MQERRSCPFPGMWGLRGLEATSPMSCLSARWCFFSSSKESGKQNGMVKLSLAVHWPDKYSSRTILPLLPFIWSRKQAAARCSYVTGLRLMRCKRKALDGKALEQEDRLLGLSYCSPLLFLHLLCCLECRHHGWRLNSHLGL